MGVGHGDQPRAVMASQVSGAGGAGGQRDRGMMWARAQRSIAASLFTAGCLHLHSCTNCRLSPGVCGTMKRTDHKGIRPTQALGRHWGPQHHSL